MLNLLPPSLRVSLSVVLLLAGLGGGAGLARAQAPASVVPAAVSVAEVQGLRPDFMLGADVSMVDQIERLGGRYTDALGRPGTALQILRASGVNWARLRLWHTPVNARDVIDGQRIVSRHGEPVGGGNNDLATTVRLAQRARAQGLKVLLDIHYSDFWTDPATQEKPAAWARLKGAALEQAVYDYTVQVLKALHAAGASPDMIQIGNEINGGLLWPDGKTWQATPGELIGGNAGMVGLLRQGIAAVRATDGLRGARLPVVLHLAEGGDNALFRRMFDLFTAERLDFDVIGLSYYPYFHGPLSGLRSNLADLAKRYGKPMAVVETAYGYTLDDGDNGPNVLNAERVQKAGYPASPQGQAQLLRDVIAAVAEVPDGLGLGVFYWEPAWIPVSGAGWRTGDGNGWDNQAMFDFSGRALPSMQVWRQVRPAAAPISRP